MRWSLAFLAVPGVVAVVGCSTGASILSKDAAATKEEVRTGEGILLPDSTPDTRVTDVGGQEAGSQDVPDTDVGTCLPGQGCFQDKCTDNDECQSGWCVQHLGEGVCSQPCQEECPAGWKCRQVGGGGPDVLFICVSEYATLCRPCAGSSDCKSPGGADDVCVGYGDSGSFCGGKCEVNDDCPWGFSCKDVQTVDGIDVQQCVADAGDCPCTDLSVELALWTPCASKNEFGLCAGKRVCSAEGLSACDAQTPASEACNGADDDCDGATDEPLEVDGDYINLCDDGNPCTDDQCKGEQGCLHETMESGECMDNDPCTVADHCVDGECVGNPVACDDDNPCTDDTCDGTGGCLFAPNSAGCDDGNPCTVADQCDQAVCSGVAIPCDCQSDADCASLEDGDACNGVLHCNVADWPYKCAVMPGTPVECAPPEPGPDAICLKATCEGATGKCLLSADHEGFACEDGDECTYGDTCVSGACASGATLSCDDGNPCTDDGCDAATGCVHQDNSAPCEDGNVCTTGDQCSGGTCVGGPGQICDDGNPCTDDSCDGKLGCTHTINSAACDDGNACTTGDQCKDGKCTFVGAATCSDGNPCTSDSCDPKVGCVYSMSSAPCDDGNLCTTGDHCELGSCIGAGKLSCNDGNACTDDSCAPGAGCQFVPNQAQCDDKNLCTTGDLCKAGWCVGGGVLGCDDSNPCTTDGCAPASGCAYTAVPDGGPCGKLAGEKCVAGKCVCTPDCAGKVCGDDGCGGVCGLCQGQDACVGGKCVCQPACAGKQCGADGCGSLCGQCQAPTACVDGLCVCAPACAGKQCGADGCGGECGQCQGQDLCLGGKCVCQPACAGKQCGLDGCGGSCGECQSPTSCVNGLCACVPACTGKECGADGCGGTCGQCPGMHICNAGKCVPVSCGTGATFGSGCVWTSPGSHSFVVPEGVFTVNVTMIGGGGGGGSGYYYPGGGGGSGYYEIKKAYGVVPGATVAIQVGSGGGMEVAGVASKFGNLTVNGGMPGKPHSSGGPQPSAKGGDGGSGGGAGYTNSGDGGGKGSGITMQGMAGAGGQPSPSQNVQAWSGQGFGAGGGSDPGTSGYNVCGGVGGTNGGDGITVGPCGGGGGGAGGLVVPGFNGNPGSGQTTAGANGVVWVTW